MASTPIKSLSDIGAAMSSATTPTVEENTADFPTTMEAAAEMAPTTIVETEDKSAPSGVSNSAPSVQYTKTTNTSLPGLVDYSDTNTSDENVQLGSIQTIEHNVTSKTSTPMSIAGQPDKVTPTIVSVEQMVAQFKVYVDNYLKQNTSMVTPFKTPKDAKICGEAFLRLVNYVMGCNHPQVFEATFAFFKEHRNGILNDIYALQGVNYLKKEESMRAQIFYQVFSSITAVPRRSINTEVVRNVFTGDQGNTLVNYLVMKTT